MRNTVNPVPRRSCVLANQPHLTLVPLQLLPATVKTQTLAQLPALKIERVHHINQLTSNVTGMNPALSRARLPQQMLAEPIHKY